MAKPIEATPSLSGEDARRFARKMIETENREPTQQEISIARQIMRMKRAAAQHIKETKDPWKCGCNICMSHLASVF